MNLIIDIGNTQAKAAVFLKDKLVALKIFPRSINPHQISALTNASGKGDKVTAAILSSVVPVQKKIQSYLKTRYFFINLNQKTLLPFKNHYITPATLGNDRLANAAAASRIFPGKNVLVIDAGTCIKYDFINADNEYMGGAISPGLDLRYRALGEFTAKLPRLKKSSQHPPALIGNSTASSIISGVENGMICEVEGMIKKYRSLNKSLQVIMAGGDADIFVNLISGKNRIFAIPDLTLLGLNTILNFNNEF